MCRFIAYLGEPIFVNDVISKPRDSLIKQSLHALESDVTVNGDGFGIGWYNLSVAPEPAVYVSILPAWNDWNLKRVSEHFIASCFFAHVRAAEEYGVGMYNCHPFMSKQYLFMHNGGIAGFNEIKLALFNLVKKEYFLNILGQTDSETFFALWLTYFSDTSGDIAGMVTAWKKALKTVEDLQKEYNIQEPSQINAVITDGVQMVGVRYASQTDAFLSLHYLAGKSFEWVGDGFHMQPTSIKKKYASVLLSSERLTVHEHEWKTIPGQHFFVLNADKTIQILPVFD